MSLVTSDALFSKQKSSKPRPIFCRLVHGIFFRPKANISSKLRKPSVGFWWSGWRCTNKRGRISYGKWCLHFCLISVTHLGFTVRVCHFFLWSGAIFGFSGRFALVGSESHRRWRWYHVFRIRWKGGIPIASFSFSRDIMSITLFLHDFFKWKFSRWS